MQLWVAMKSAAGAIHHGIKKVYKAVVTRNINNNVHTIAKHEQQYQKNERQHVNTMQREQWHPNNMQDPWKMSQK